MDKASSHLSRSTAGYLANKESKTGIKCILFDEIRVKSPHASAVDFCAFGILKRALGKRHPRTLNEKILWLMCSHVAVRNNISKRWNTTENDVPKNLSSDDSAIRLPNTSILNSNVADITEYFLDVYQTTIY
ncbi:uncharacterized protein TNCV_703421 [Trichonephila clavipes]|nr:uncharacterized protein TNCV_703421 [Trichonephila clavipes]